MEYIYHTDAGHGWLQVDITELQRLNLMGKISAYSYQLGKYAYLEEDADAGIFLNKKKQLNEKYTIKEKDDGDNSPIRGYPSFEKTKDISTGYALKGKSGWKSESARHALARKGIETGRKKKTKGTWILKKQTPVQLVFEDIKGNLIGIDKSYGVKGYHVSAPAKEGHGEPKLISEKKGIKKIWLPEAGAYQYERFKSKKDALKFANKLMEKKM